MISPKYFLFGISGVGVTVGSLAAWQLTKRTKPATTNSTAEITVNSDQNQENLKSASNKNVQEPQSYQNKIYEECGWYIWLSSQDDESIIMNRSEKNPKGKNYDEWIQCLTTHQQAYNTK